MNAEEAAEKIKADWRERVTGGCRMLSEGLGKIDECKCVLCCADFLRGKCEELEAEVCRLQREIAQLKYAQINTRRQKSIEERYGSEDDRPRAITSNIQDYVITGSDLNGIMTLDVNDGPVRGAQG